MDWLNHEPETITDEKPSGLLSSPARRKEAMGCFCQTRSFRAPRHAAAASTVACASLRGCGGVAAPDNAFARALPPVQDAVVAIPASRGPGEGDVRGCWCDRSYPSSACSTWPIAERGGGYAQMSYLRRRQRRRSARSGDSFVFGVEISVFCCQKPLSARMCRAHRCSLGRRSPCGRHPIFTVSTQAFG